MVLMKVSTKIIVGYSLLILLMGGAVAYQVLLIHRVQRISSELSSVNFQAALIALRLDGNLRAVEELLSKYLLLGDSDYGDLLKATEAQFEGHLVEMSEVTRTDAETEALQQLQSAWRDLLVDIERVESTVPAGSYTILPVSLENQIRRTYVRVDTIYATIGSGIDAEVQVSSLVSEQARRVSWTAGSLALLLAGSVGFLTVRSISTGLGRLTGGTRAVAAGRFDHQISEDRNDEFGELAKNFNSMAGRLAELDQLKKDFVSSVSHELKSPIASSREVVQLMLEEVPGPLSPEQKRLLKLNLRNYRKLSSMVGGLLELARTDAGIVTCERRPNDLGTLIQRTVEDYELALKDRDLRLETDLPAGSLLVECDGDRIMQVLGNLLENAIKVSPRGSAIRIALQISAARDNAKSEIQVSVFDSGPGVPDKHKQRIFDRFRQLRSTSGTSRPGVGLGLAICHSIVKRHEGKIWVEDNLPGGSIFRVKFPARVLPVKAAAHAATTLLRPLVHATQGRAPAIPRMDPS